MNLSLTYEPWMFAPALPLAAFGLYLLFTALLRDRSKGRQRCPKCWYDLPHLVSGPLDRFPSAPPRCSECGHTAAKIRDLHRTRRRWLLAACALPLLIPLTLLTFNLTPARIYYALMPRWSGYKDETCNGSTLRIYYARNPADRAQRLVVLGPAGTVVNLPDADWVFLSGTTIRNWGDFNSDGTPELVFVAATKSPLRVHFIIVEARSSGPAVVVHTNPAIAPTINGSRDPSTLIMFDSSFALANPKFRTGSSRGVEYRLNSGALHVVLDWLNEPSQAQKSFDSTARRISTYLPMPGSTARSELWQELLELTYRGQTAEAQRFLDAAWPASLPGKEGFRKSFLTAVAKDPICQDIAAAQAAQSAGLPIPASKLGTSGK